jgi:hypothetical protein
MRLFGRSQKDYSPKFGCRILHRRARESREDGLRAHPPRRAGVYMLWCWIDMRWGEWDARPRSRPFYAPYFSPYVGRTARWNRNNRLHAGEYSPL